jgi:hypothetical protein
MKISRSSLVPAVLMNKTTFQAPNSTAGSSTFGAIRSSFPARNTDGAEVRLPGWFGALL